MAVEITPLSPLAYATRYRVVLTGALRSSSGGEIRPPRGLGSPEDLLSFVTQPVPPQPPVLASTEPAAGSTGADGGSPVFATFSKPMDPLTMNSTTVMLIAESGDAVAVGLTCCGDDDGTLRVDPVEPMAAGVYRLVFGDGVTDRAGLPMLPDTVGFRVGVEARPVVPSGPGRLTIQVIPASVASRTKKNVGAGSSTSRKGRISYNPGSKSFFSVKPKAVRPVPANDVVMDVGGCMLSRPSVCGS